MSADALRRELEAAKRHDEQARQHRQRAGLILLRAGDLADRARLAKAAGIGYPMAELLCGMAPVEFLAEAIYGAPEA